MFYDRAKIFVRSGNGGDGMISFRREKHVPRGGPNGGDGGRGGDILLVVNLKKNSLVLFHRRNHFRAGNGGNGQPNNRKGANGKTLRLEIPPGTTICNADSGEVLADLIHDDDELLILAGGRGGRGNARFSSSTNQAPRLAERGEPGSEMWLELELKLIADIGIIGVPNAGKSTLLSVISAANPKIANYPFTTLHPNLGVVTLNEYETMVFADIPGLIEGASMGVGLGYDFLRHVERTKVLIHLLDGTSDDPLRDWAMINQELTLYDARLENKSQLVVLNKIDLQGAVTWQQTVEEKVLRAGFHFCAISAVTKEGVQQMLYKVKQILDLIPQTEEDKPQPLIIKPGADEGVFSIDQLDDGWKVSGIRIERIAAMTYWEFEEPVRRFQRIMEDMGITDALVKAGVKTGDTVHIGDQVLEWTE
jgi:GTP-binding protein